MSTLVLFPTALTRRRLQEAMQQAPVNIDWQRLHILLGWETDQQASSQEYTATFSSFGFVWAEEEGLYLLVGTMESPQIAQRRAELGHSAEEPIYLVFSTEAEPGFTNRSWVASLSTTLATREGVFTFGPEQLIG